MKMQLNGHILFSAALMLSTFFLLACEVHSIPVSGELNYNNDIETDPEGLAYLAFLRLIAQSYQKYNTDKRGMDLGLGRGYSGSLTAKHLMGLASANYAGGPGRKRRSTTLV